MPKIFLLREKLSSNFDALLGHPKGQHEESLSRRYGDDESDGEDELEEVFTRPPRLARARRDSLREEPPQPAQKKPESDTADTAPGESCGGRLQAAAGAESHQMSPVMAGCRVRRERDDGETGGLW